MDCIRWQRWLNRICNRKSGQNKATTPKTFLQLELLEIRDVPAVVSPTFVLDHALGTVTPLATAGPTGYSPAQIRQAYGFNQISMAGGVTGDGSGTTIAIVDAYDDPTIASDLHQFDVQFGLADPTFTKVNQSGGATLPAANTGWSDEISLDVEWAHAIAPKANILLVEANDSSDTNLFSAVQYAAQQSGVVAVSMSWGGSEFSGESSYDSVFQTPSGHSGVAFVASSGDNGAPVSYPGISPNVLTVGGTTLNLDSSGDYVSESGWSGSGGGLSAYEPQPSYQNGVVTQTSVYRTNPDVSYDANPSTGFPVYLTYGNSTTTPWLQFGGTSDAAPQWAALIAIADQGRALQGEAALNGSTTQLLPMIYQLPAGDFHDVTGGTSTGSPNYSAGSGYDLVTGRGSPYANLVVAGLIGSTPVTPTATHFSVSAPSSATAGSSFSVTVTALSSNNQVVAGYTGTVHFSSTDVAAGLPANYTFVSGDNGAHTFTVTLKTAGSQSITATDTSTASITGSASLTVTAATPTSGSGSLIEGFETSSTYYIAGYYAPTVSLSTAAAHDGTYGLDNASGNDWIYRNDAAAQVKQGDSLSVWVKFANAADGRAYFGFGASASGTLSVVLAPNTNQLILNDNTGYNFYNLNRVAQRYLPNHWYRVQVDWGTSGTITARLFDSNGTTQLSSVSAVDGNIVSGGIAFRAIGSDKYFDTVTDNPGVDVGMAQPASVALPSAPASAVATTASQKPLSTPATVPQSREALERTLAAVDHLFAQSAREALVADAVSVWQNPTWLNSLE